MPANKAQGFKSQNDPENTDNYYIDEFIDMVPKLRPVTKAVRDGSLKALDAIEAAFGPKGEYWIKGDYGRHAVTDEDENGDNETIDDVFNGMCLSGAAALVNGKYESVARAALSLAIADYEDNLAEAAYGEADLILTSFNDNEQTTWKDIKEVFKGAKKIVASASA